MENQFLKWGRAVLDAEAHAVLDLKLDENFAAAVDLVLKTPGRLIVSGMGKSGHIGKKIAATLASTGTPAYFVHPAEASHGDLGMITQNDLLLALSYSGESEELLKIIPPIQRQGAKIVALTGNKNSALAKSADIHLNCHVAREACPFDLVPTSSTTAALALGDALAVVLLKARGFGVEDFARSHPGGALGRRLLTRVKDIMRKGENLPIVPPDSLMTNAILKMSQGGLGMVIVADSKHRPLGIFTDGDLRRAFEKNVDLKMVKIRDLMHENPQCIDENKMATEVVALMERFKINAVIAVNAENKIVGALNTHDLLDAKVL